MPSERALNLVQAVMGLHKPKPCPSGIGSRGYKEGNGPHKVGPTEQVTKKEEVEIPESQMISAVSGNYALDQGKHPKDKADDFYKLTVGFLRKNGFFQGLVTGDISYTLNSVVNCFSATVSTLNEDDRYVSLSYAIRQSNGEVQNFDSKIPLVSTACRYGGFRYWFECIRRNNGKYCGRRVATLYLLDGQFGCRHCHDLTYASRSLSGWFEKVGVLDVELAYAADDPKHWRYYKGKETRRFKRMIRMSDKYNKWQEIYKAKAMLDINKAEAMLETTRAKCKRIRDRVNTR